MGPASNRVSSTGASKPFADERCGADDQDPVVGLRRGEPVDCRTPIRSGHSALQQECLMSASREERSQSFDMGDPAGQHETVAPLGESSRDVVDDLCVSCLISDQGPQPATMADRHDPRRAQIHLADYHRHTENLGLERHRQVLLNHDEETTELLMLVVSVHERVGDQGIELGITV
jgi:hypothetical protein